MSPSVLTGATRSHTLQKREYSIFYSRPAEALIYRDILGIVFSIPQHFIATIYSRNNGPSNGDVKQNDEKNLLPLNKLYN